MKDGLEKKIKNALAKKAVGYEAKEVVEEYQEEDGSLKLTKKRVTKKHVPPDYQAAKIILEEIHTEKPLRKLTDEELELEKKRLLAILKGDKNED